MKHAAEVYIQTGGVPQEEEEDDRPKSEQTNPETVLPVAGPIGASNVGKTE